MTIGNPFTSKADSFVHMRGAVFPMYLRLLGQHSIQMSSVFLASRNSKVISGYCKRTLVCFVMITGGQHVSMQ